MSETLPPALERGVSVGVLGVYSRGLDLLVGDDVYSIVPAQTGNLPRGVLVELPAGFDWKEQGLRQGATVAVGEGWLDLPRGLRLDMTGAGLWRVRRSLGSVGLSAAGLRTSATLAAGALAGSAGLGVLADRLPAVSRGEVAVNADDNPLVAVAAGPLSRLVWGTLVADEKSFFEGARKLMGLGIGLTPSGDDLLTGYLGSLALLVPHLPGAGWVKSAAVALGHEAGARTTPLAATYLRRAVEGAITERQERLLTALTAGDPELSLAACHHLRQFGHSSGAEIALGTLLATMVAAALLG